jgi:hypothetical protein
MKVSEAANLLDANSRYFVEVYKQFNFKDETELKDYCDFVMHEPQEWMRGFPSKWKSRGLFTRPRAAFVKLMKHVDVIAALGEEYAQRVYSVVWRAFKDHTDTILLHREGARRSSMSIVDHFEEEESRTAEYLSPRSPFLTVREESIDCESMHSLKLPRPAARITPLRERGGSDHAEAMRKVIQTLLEANKSCPLYETTRLLLDLAFPLQQPVDA